MANESVEHATIVLVTAKNHEWAAKFTGRTIEEIHRLYQEAQDRDEVCTVEVK